MQQISLLPVYTGVIPNKQTQNDYDFANNIFGFINYSGNTLIPYFNDTITDLNILSDQINTKADEVATNTQTVSDKTALVQSITASLPAGTVLDSAVGATSTWSSSKIKTLLDNITAIITSSDTSLDSFQEIVAYIKQNKTVLDTLAISNIAGLVSALAGKLGVNDTAASAVTLTIPATGYKHLGSWGNDGITAGNGNILVNSAYRAEYAYGAGNANYANSSNYANSAGVANSISTAVAISAIAGANTGEIGTYAFLLANGFQVNAGGNYAGSSLRYVALNASSINNSYNNNVSIYNNGAVPTGTWKCMGHSAFNLETGGAGVTLFLRIA